MRELWKVLIVELHALFWQDTKRVFLELRCVHAVGFRGEDLDWHSDVVDLLLGEQGRMRDADRVD